MAATAKHERSKPFPRRGYAPIDSLVKFTDIHFFFYTDSVK